jgi:hypothetical protein
MKQLRNAIFITAIVAVLLTGVIAFIENQQQVDKQFIKEETSDLLSYTNETTYVLQLYHSEKLPKIYVKIHTQYLNKKTTSLYDQTTTADVPEQYRKDLERTETIALQLSQLLSSVSSSPPNDISSMNHSQLAQIKQELIELQKKYE